MTTAEKYREFVRNSNSSIRPPVPPGGQKAAILEGFRAYLTLIENLKHIKDEYDNLTFVHYDTFLSQAMTGWNSYKPTISTSDFYEHAKDGFMTRGEKEFTDIVTKPLPSYSDEFQEKIEKAKPKANTLESLTVHIGSKIISVKTSYIASAFVSSLAMYGIFLNLKNHITSVKQLAAMFTGFHYRLKEVWYQEGSVKIGKDDGSLSKDKKLSLKEFGINAEYYQFLGMLNYPKQLKSTLRRQTGVGTDLIDLILYYRNVGLRLEGEDERLRKALRYKMRFWNETQCKLLLDFIKDNANNSSLMDSFCVVFLSVMSLKQPTQDHRFFFPAYLLKAGVGKLDTIDFSAQGAWMQIQKLAEAGMPSPNTSDDLAYSILLAMTGMHLSDQRIFSLLFKIKPKTRADLNMGNFPTAAGKEDMLKVPQPQYWTKLYKGQAGGGGVEQKGVLHNIAATTIYSGDDFIIAANSNLPSQTYGSDPFSFLEREQRKLMSEVKGVDIIFGSQLLHGLSTLTKKGEIRSGNEITTRGRVICFFSSSPGSSFPDSTASLGQGYDENGGVVSGKRPAALRERQDKQKKGKTFPRAPISLGTLNPNFPGALPMDT